MVASIKLTPAAAIEKLAPMTGQYCWGVMTDTYGVLRIDFGEPHLEFRHPSARQNDPDLSAALERVYSRRFVSAVVQWRLFVWEGFWTIHAPGDMCDRTVAEAGDNTVPCLSALNGQKLASIAWDAASGEWRFSFDLGGLLAIKREPGAPDTPVDPKVDHSWSVFFEGGGNLTCVRDDWMELEPPGEAG
ncbi:MAG: hypothetical protein P4L76_03685 [Beijerinckiaceae bacterium]|nr:hypothetical protein [Beijerinckiaceae bacterium]